MTENTPLSCPALIAILSLEKSSPMSQCFERVNFIKTPRKYDPKTDGAAPLFRRRFTVSEPITSATMYVCGLGLGYYYLNGAPVSDDLFTAPCSDYRKTLWYNRYDVTEQLCQGDNIMAVQCGNGWYNEPFATSCDHNTAPWRDNPKFILVLEVNGRRVLSSDANWKCTDDSAVIYNQLRSGEYFDARLYDRNWMTLDFDDSAWTNAVSDTTPPTGTFRETLWEPIRADRVYPAIEMWDKGEGRYIFDLGQNMSGFVRLSVDERQESGDKMPIIVGVNGLRSDYVVTIVGVKKNADKNNLTLGDFLKYDSPRSISERGRFGSTRLMFQWQSASRA